MTHYQLEFKPYRRPFKRSLHTHHGLWSDRFGVVLKLTADSGQIGFGEIASLEWFGSESTDQSLKFCNSLPKQITPDTVFSIPASLPACQFGFEAAWEMATGSIVSSTPLSLNCSRLLPTGASALQAWKPFWEKGDRIFKWKIGVAPVQEELGLLERLLQQLPQQATLRLDANGGLGWDDARQWLDACSDRPQIEFLEQPLPSDQLEAMLELSQRYSTPLALDESVATLDQLETCYERGWRGIFVIKAAIAGSPNRLRQFCQNQGVDVVWSSVFETAIAQQFIKTCLISSLPQQQRAIGFGVDHWFADDLNNSSMERVWQNL